MKTVRILGSLPLRTTCTSSVPRSFSTSTIFNAAQQSNKKKVASTKEKSKRKRRLATYQMPNMKDIQQYSLCDAMQYIQAFEVGRPGDVPKYDLSVRFKTKRDGPVVRSAIKLPNPVKTGVRICAFVEPNTKAAEQAKAAGASLVGLDEIIEQIKAGHVDFDRCITTPEFLPALAKAGIPRILGPKGLMPNAKVGTVVMNIGEGVSAMIGGSAYRERSGILSMAIGQLGYTPEQLRDNIKTLMTKIKKEAAQITDNQGHQKDIWEVMLSSSHSPCFSLNGQFRSTDSVKMEALTKS